MDAIEVVGGTVAVSMSRAVYAVHLNKQEGWLFCSDVIADDGGQFGISAGMVGYVKIVLDDTVCDRIPIAEGAERSIGHDLSNTSEERGVGRIDGVRGRGYDAIGQAVYFRADAEQHGSPTFGTDGGLRSEGAVGDGTVCKDAVKMGGISLLYKRSGTVDTDNNDVRIYLF